MATKSTWSIFNTELASLLYEKIMQCTIQMKSLYKSKANAHYLKRTKVGISFSIVLSQSMKRKKFKWNFAFTPKLTVTLTFPVEFYIYCSSYGLHFYTSQMEILQSMKDSFFCNLYWGLLTEVVVVSNALVSNKFLKAHIFDAALIFSNFFVIIHRFIADVTWVFTLVWWAAQCEYLFFSFLNKWKFSVSQIGFLAHSM